MWAYVTITYADSSDISVSPMTLTVFIKNTKSFGMLKCIRTSFCTSDAIALYPEIYHKKYIL